MTLKGENFSFWAFTPDKIRETAPHACGLAIDVPFIN